MPANPKIADADLKTVIAPGARGRPGQGGTDDERRVQPGPPHVLRAGAMMATLRPPALPRRPRRPSGTRPPLQEGNDVLKQLGGGSVEKGGAGIQLTAPDIAGERRCGATGRDQHAARHDLIAILVEKNPNTLAATFAIPAGTDPFVSTRVKMGETSTVTLPCAPTANGCRRARK